MQRALESKGIPTVSITVALDVTNRAKPPRSVLVPFMMGHHFGVPHHKTLQCNIITKALDHLVNAEKSGEVKHLPYTWAQVRKEGIAIKKSLGIK
ncbi:MAG TPA: hypothetical protein VF149_05540 [Bacillales bacterium]